MSFMVFVLGWAGVILLIYVFSMARMAYMYASYKVPSSQAAISASDWDGGKPFLSKNENEGVSTSSKIRSSVSDGDDLVARSTSIYPVDKLFSDSF